MSLAEERPAAPATAGVPSGLRGDLVYETARDTETWDRLSSGWEDAALRVGFHMSHAWLRAWWETYGEGRLAVGAVRSGDRLVALAPLCRQHRRLWGLPVRAVENLFNAHAARSDVSLLERETEALHLVLDALDREPWDLVLLQEVPETARLLELLPEACRARGWALHTRPSLDSPYLVMQGDWDSFYSTLSKKFRQDIRAKLKRLQASGSLVTIECVTGAERIAAVMPEVMAVAESSWSGERGSSIASPPHRKFYETGFRAFAERDQLRVWTLRVGGMLAAFAIEVCWGRTLVGIKRAYHPSFAQLSVGSVLEAHMLEAAYRSGEFDRYDMLGKNEFYKMRWTDRLERHVEVFIFNTRTRSRVLRLLEFSLRPRLGAVKRRATRLLGRAKAAQ